MSFDCKRGGQWRALEKKRSITMCICVHVCGWACANDNWSFWDIFSLIILEHNRQKKMHASKKRMKKKQYDTRRLPMIFETETHADKKIWMKIFEWENARCLVVAPNGVGI